jgi:hypothetical protein
MTEAQQLRWWREATGRQTPSRVELGLTVQVDGMTVRLSIPEQHSETVIPKNLIRRMMGQMKPPKAKRRQPVKLASLPYGQEAEYNRVMGRAA